MRKKGRKGSCCKYGGCFFSLGCLFFSRWLFWTARPPSYFNAASQPIRISFPRGNEQLNGTVTAKNGGGGSQQRQQPPPMKNGTPVAPQQPTATRVMATGPPSVRLTDFRCWTSPFSFRPARPGLQCSRDAQHPLAKSKDSAQQNQSDSPACIIEFFFTV